MLRTFTLNPACKPDDLEHYFMGINYGPPIDVYVPGILLANGSQGIVRKRVFNS